MDTKNLITHFGNVKSVAIEMNVSVQAVYTWLKKGLPPIRQEQAERITNGALKATARAVDELVN